MNQVIYLLTIPFPVPFNRDQQEWTIAHHKMVFHRLPTKQEVLMLLHEKGNESYQQSGNEENRWWDLIEVLSSFPKERWINGDGFNEPLFVSANRPFTHPIMGDTFILWERKEIESLD